MVEFAVACLRVMLRFISAVSMVAWNGFNFVFPSQHYRRYEYYFALLRDFPQVKFTLNGGITTIDQVSFCLTIECSI
jgi:hypothetical protein